MCGVCGIVGKPLPETASRVHNMMGRMPHRGPDDNGFWQSDDGRVSLGHVRLAIVDTSDAGAQPMHHSADLHLVANGEIYNYPTLRKTLEKDSEFSSHCDSEVILHGHYIEGDAFLNSIDGMFAYALYDGRTETLTLARDRLGIKPLYYTIYKGELLFASEIKALFGAIDGHVWNIDRQGLSEFLTYQSPLGENTLFEGIKQVLPGNVLIVDIHSPDKVKQSPFWKAQLKPDNSMIFEDALTAFSEAFDKSIKRHLLSDVPVASYLSSGFDSSSVFDKAQRLYDQKMNEPGMTAYTGWFEGYDAWYDETGPAAELAELLGANHRKVEINAHSLVDHLDGVIDALDEPRMGMGAFSQYMVARDVARDYKVILTGHGGDELFSGYPIFAYAQNNIAGIRKKSEIPQFAYYMLSDLQRHLSPEFGRGLPVLWPVAKQAKLLGMAVDDLKPWQQLDHWTHDVEQRSDKILMTYLKAYLPGLLIVEDKISMAHSLESRTPLLDNDLIDLSLSIPSDIKLNGGQLKAIIKQYARSNLPATYFEQPKRGFPTPLRKWLRNDLANMVTERLCKSENYLSAIFQPEELASFVKQYNSSLRRHVRPLDEIQSHRMWQLLSLESWLRTWSQKYGVTLKLS